MRIADGKAARQRFVRVDIGRDGLNTGAGAAADDRDRGSRGNGCFAAKALHHAALFGIRAGAAFRGEQHRRFVHLGGNVLEHLEVPRFGHGAFKRNVARLQEAVEAHNPQADRTLPHGGIFRTRHFGRRTVNVIRQHIVEEAHHIFDKLLVAIPLIPCFHVERGEAAHSRAVIAQMVTACRQRDF